MALFNPLSPLWNSLIGTRNWLFDQKFIKPVQLKIPVLSVGNITMGGTGKTPFIHWLIGEVLHLGYNPGIVSRNYRADSQASGWVHSEPGAYKIFGDESVLLKTKNPQIPIYSGAQKWKSAQKITTNTPTVDLVLVDDGFQHRKLQRDLDIVLLDVSVSPKDYEWPPYGRAREPLSNLKRADVLVLTRWEQRQEKTFELLQPFLDSAPLILKAEQIQSKPQWIAGRPFSHDHILQTGRGLAFCGLGNPTSFFKSLEAQGLKIGEVIRFADHFSYGPAAQEKLFKQGANFDYLVTSEKDLVKLQEWPSNGPSLCMVPLQLHIFGALEAFREKLAHCLRKNSK